MAYAPPAHDFLPLQAAWLIAATATDINASGSQPGTRIPYDGTATRVDSEAWEHDTANNHRLKALFAGTARFYVLVSATSAVVDANVIVRIAKNGAGFLRGQASHGLITNTNSNNTGTWHLESWDLNVAVNDYYEVFAQREAATGTITLDITHSFFHAQRLE